MITLDELKSFQANEQFKLMTDAMIERYEDTIRDIVDNDLPNYIKETIRSKPNVRFILFRTDRPLVDSDGNYPSEKECDRIAQYIYSIIISHGFSDAGVICKRIFSDPEITGRYQLIGTEISIKIEWTVNKR